MSRNSASGVRMRLLCTSIIRGALQVKRAQLSVLSAHPQRLPGLTPQ